MRFFQNKSGKPQTLSMPSGLALTLRVEDCVAGEWFARYGKPGLGPLTEVAYLPEGKSLVMECHDPKASSVAKMLGNPKFYAEVQRELRRQGIVVDRGESEEGEDPKEQPKRGRPRKE